VISKVLLPQSNINDELVSHTKFLSDSSPGLPKYNKLYRKQFTVAFLMDMFCSPVQAPGQSVQISKYNISFYSVNAY